MHEMSYMIRLADIALAELAKNPHAIPDKLIVEIGELTGVLPEYLKKYYPAVVKDTPLSNSMLEVISIPAEAECEQCKTHYHPDRTNDYRCPKCNSIQAHFLHGRELSVREIILKTHYHPIA